MSAFDKWDFVRGALAVALIACNVGVWRGVSLEYSVDIWTKETGRRLLVTSLAFEAFLAAVLFVVDTSVSVWQKSEIASLESRLDDRTAELIEVRKRAADRSLSPEEQTSLTKALSSFPGQRAKIIVFPVTFEGVWIAEQIYGAMLNAKWDVSFPERPIKPPNDFMVQGSFIDASDDDVSQKAATALFEALKLTGVPSGAAPHGGLRPKPLQFDPSQPLVWMLIGDKPTPLLNWVK
jgi:hypothetical protein